MNNIWTWEASASPCNIIVISNPWYQYGCEWYIASLCRHHWNTQSMIPICLQWQGNDQFLWVIIVGVDMIGVGSAWHTWWFCYIKLGYLVSCSHIEKTPTFLDTRHEWYSCYVKLHSLGGRFTSWSTEGFIILKSLIKHNCYRNGFTDYICAWWDNEEDSIF